MEMSIARNVGLGSMQQLSRGGLLSSRRETSFAKEWGTRLQLKYGRLGDSVDTLSGGNQQKVVLAKWLARAPKVLIVDEPTRGIDVGTKAEVHRLILDLARQGVAVVVISSELPEVLALADRILVMREGRLVREFSRSEATEELVIGAATTSGAVAA
jgi:rhamnose transport system ATP-binding protein